MYHDGSESIILFFKRWYKLYYDFCRVKGSEKIFNISKIPDIYDSIKYDLIMKLDLIFFIILQQSNNFVMIQKNY